MPPRVPSQLRGWVVGSAARAARLALAPRRPVSVPHPHTIRRILVVKPCCLGDLLMATPALRTLAHHYAHARIDVLTSTWAAPALAGNPHVDQIITYSEPPRLGALRATAADLRRRHYDIGISLDRSPLVNGLLRLAGIPIRAGIDNRGRGVGLTHPTTPRLGQHESLLFLDVVGRLGVGGDDCRPEYTVTDAARARVSEFLPPDSAPLAVLHPGGAVNPGARMPSKRWPTERFGELASRLVRDRGAAVAFVGAASDRQAVETARLVAGVPVIDLCERLALPELAALCERAAVYVGNDSGASHLAVAAGAPTVTIFGPTSPRRYRPLGRSSRVCAPDASWEIVDGIDLRGTAARHPDVDIDHVTVDHVLAACVEILECPDYGAGR